MFEKIYLDPENRCFAEIMSNNRRYVVPPFQRDYSWEDEQWAELWADIEQMRQGQTQHFMGYLVLQTEDGKSFQIYPRDAEVRQHFGDKSMPSRRSSKKIMFLLRSIETHLSGQAPPKSDARTCVAIQPRRRLAGLFWPRGL